MHFRAAAPERGYNCCGMFSKKPLRRETDSADDEVLYMQPVGRKVSWGGVQAVKKPGAQSPEILHLNMKKEPRKVGGNRRRRQANSGHESQPGRGYSPQLRGRAALVGSCGVGSYLPGDMGQGKSVCYGFAEEEAACKSASAICDLKAAPLDEKLHFW